MTTAAPHIDTVPSGITEDSLESSFREELPCEANHTANSACTTHVQWSMPPRLCGCTPRRVVCQGAHDYTFAPWRSNRMHCPECGEIHATEDARKGWIKI